MREYKVVFGKNPMRPGVVYVNANNAGEAINFVMETYNVYRNMIRMTTWVNKNEVSQG